MFILGASSGYFVYILVSALLTLFCLLDDKVVSDADLTNNANTLAASNINIDTQDSISFFDAFDCLSIKTSFKAAKIFSLKTKEHYTFTFVLASLYLSKEHSLRAPPQFII